MSKYVITAADMDSRKRRAAATGMLWAALGESSSRHGEMTTLEWMDVLNTIQARVVAMGLKEELAGDDGADEPTPSAGDES